MSSLVLELQHGALNSTVGVADLLRKAYVVAVKLGLVDFEKWIDLELNGYVHKSEQPPDYRVVVGTLKAFNPYVGYIPLIIQDADLADRLSHRRINCPISEVEATSSEDGSHVALGFPEAAKIQLMRRMGDPFEPSLHVSRISFRRIVDTVRSAVLKWSLELEKGGILGKGLSFSSQEKEIAARKQSEFSRTININIIGTMTDSSLQQGSPGAGQAS